MADIHDVTDYVICRLVDGGVHLNQLKLQKLLFYVQAWHLAHHGRPLVPARFQAWVHGPVSREVFDRFRGSKMLYSPIVREDVRPGFNSEHALRPEERAIIDSVLEVYAPLSADQLEGLTHREDPWMAARGERAPDERCEQEIDEGLMATYYRARLTA